MKLQEIKSLPEICEIKTGKMDANHAVPDGKYRFYTCANNYLMCNTKSFSGPCVIIPGNGDIGLVFYYDGEFEAYQRTYVLHNIKIFPKYLYYHLYHRWRDHNSDKQFGSTVRYVRMANFTSYKLPVPDIKEQEQIVARIEEMFSQLDAGVETLKKTKAQLAVYRQAVLKEAFEGKLTSEWRKINNSDINSVLSKINKEKEKRGKSEKYHLEYDISLAPLPDCWKWVFIGDISNGPVYGTSQKSEKKGVIPVIRMGNLQNGKIEWDDLVYSNDNEEIEKYRLVKGDVLFNRTNSPELVGKTAIYQGEQEAIFAGYLIRINQMNCINPAYLTYYLNSFTARNYGNKVKTDGVNQSNINGKKLCSYPFPLCSIEEQAQVVYELETRLSVCDSIEKTVDIAFQQSEAMRQCILKKTFEGGY